MGDLTHNPVRPAHPRWMTIVLKLAGIYNVLWGAITVVYPGWLFDLTGLEAPSYPFIWQCVGMIVGVYGLGYWIAAYDPFRHWPIVLVGFLGKVFGPMGYIQGVFLADAPIIGTVTNPVPPEFGVALITNDLVWWVPFAMILWASFRAMHAPSGGAEPLATVLESMKTDRGTRLIDRTRQDPVLLVLLRHAGCTFCKEALADLARARESIEEAGVVPVVVHMGDSGDLDPLLAARGLLGVETVADPGRRLYRALELPRGSFRQLFGPPVWARGIAATLRGHMVGRLAGDGFQMPGTVLLRDGTVIARHDHATAADRADFAALACGIDPQNDRPVPATAAPA